MPDTDKQMERESIVLRICWMLVFTLIWYVAEILLAFVIVLQLLCRLFQGQTNVDLLQVGDSLSQYLAQIGQFGSFNTEDKPWPFSDWPTPRLRESNGLDDPAAVVDVTPKP